jgi:Flp pilus assembly protein TadD
MTVGIPSSPSSNALPRGLMLLGLAAIPMVIGFAIHLGAVQNDFIWDDPIVLKQQLHAFHSLGDIFFPPKGIPQFGDHYYRPIGVLTYVIDRWLWGDTPLGFHLPVVVFHTVNCLFVFLLGLRLFRGARLGAAAAVAGAALFAAHPIHTESVFWMAGRSDVLATLALLPALLVYFKWKDDTARWRWLVVSALLFAVACFSKETGLSLLFVVVAADMLGIGGREMDADPATDAGARAGAAAAQNPPRGEERRRAQGKKGRSGGAPGRPPASREPGLLARGLRYWQGWLLLAGVGSVYFMIRSAALASEGTPLRAQESSTIVGIENIITALGFYVSKFFVPVRLTAYIPEIPDRGLNLLLGIAGMLAGGAILWLGTRRGGKSTAFLTAWFFATLAPSLSVAFFQVSKTPIAERYLYLPSVGLCLLAGYLAFVRLPALVPEKTKKMATLLAAAALVAVTTACAAGTVARGRIWRSDFDFWTDVVAKWPDWGLPHLHLGLVYNEQGRDDLAEQQYKLALETKYSDDGRAKVCNDLGMLYMGRNDLDGADFYFRKAIELKRDYATPYYGLGITGLRRGEDSLNRNDSAAATRHLAGAESSFKKAIGLNPQYVKALGALGRLLHLVGRDREASTYVDKVLQLVSAGPEYEEARRNKAAIENAAGVGRR